MYISLNNGGTLFSSFSHVTFLLGQGKEEDSLVKKKKREKEKVYFSSIVNHQQFFLNWRTHFRVKQEQLKIWN